MTNTRLFVAIGIASLALGAGLWHFGNPARPPAQAALPRPAVAPAALFAATFRDAAGEPRALGQYQGKLVVLNFWATWCGPCRDEMPAFNRVYQRWSGRGVQVVGLSDDPPDKSARFGRELAIAYPLWTGGEEVAELSRRLGNSGGVLPHTVLLGPAGEVLEQRVGPYTEEDLEQLLTSFAAKSG